MSQRPNFTALYGMNAPAGIPATPLIINACLTGNVPTRATNPHVPVSTSEIIDDALAVAEAGATMLHLHARDAEGRPTWRPEAFAPILSGIRRHNRDVILIVTTSGRNCPQPEQRAAVLEMDGDAKPDMGSLSLGSLNFPTGPSMNAPETILFLADRMRQRGITPELEAFEPGWLNTAFYMRRKGWLPETCYINLLLGSLGSMPGRVDDLCAMVRDLPCDWTWSAAGIGRHQLAMNAAAIIMGGHVRVGIEDNLYFDFAERAPASNPALVQRIVRLAGEMGRPIAKAPEVRRQLRLGDPANWEATQIDVRPMTSADLDVAYSILSMWNMSPLQPECQVPDPESWPIEPSRFFVATHQGRVIGLAGYHLVDAVHAVTASLAVHPDYLGCGVGEKLQRTRLEALRGKGIRHVRTECDRPEVIAWYVRHFGCRIAGYKPKKHAFSRPDKDRWALLDLDLPG